MNHSSDDPDIFFEAEWKYRTWRATITVVLCGSLGGFVLFLAIRGFLYQKDIWEHYNWILGLFFAAFGSFFTFVSGLILVRMISGVRETSRIDTGGIKIGRAYWRWDQMRFIRPTKESSGGIIILIALKGKADRRFWIGRPLNKDEYNKLNERMLPFLESKYPHLLE